MAKKRANGEGNIRKRADGRWEGRYTAGFKLAWGMVKELETDGLYSFEQEEEEHICHPAEQDI